MENQKKIILYAALGIAGLVMLYFVFFNKPVVVAPPVKKAPAPAPGKNTFANVGVAAATAAPGLISAASNLVKSFAPGNGNNAIPADVAAPASLGLPTFDTSATYGPPSPTDTASVGVYGPPSPSVGVGVESAPGPLVMADPDTGDFGV